MHFALSSILISTTLLITLASSATKCRADIILIAAAASLSDVLKDVDKLYQNQSQHNVKLTLGPSNYLARQIEEGAPADIFFSADLAQMDILDRKQRLEPGTRRNMLSNQLVLITPADSRLKISAPMDLLQTGIRRIALADPNHVPAGVYTRQYLNDQKLWEKVKTKIVPVLDVRAALATVESGNAEVAMVYRTDAAASNGVKIVFSVPLDKGPQITYPIAMIKDSKKKAAAGDFLQYLSSAMAKSTFTKYGFIVLE